MICISSSRTSSRRRPTLISWCWPEISAWGSVPPRFARDLLTPAFASNLEDLMDGGRVQLWIHGHTHDPFDYEIHGTRVVCNPRGYAPYELTPGFRPDFVVEI